MYPFTSAGEAATCGFFFSDDRWPERPYCGHNKTASQIRTLKHAIRRPYMQANPPCLAFRLVFDIDKPNGMMAWRYADLAAPNWTVTNPVNGHAHLVYELATPVVTSFRGHPKPIRFAAAIESRYQDQLGADEYYVGLLVKTPGHPEWITRQWRSEPYDLSELAEYIDLETPTQRTHYVSGLGRNCELFDRLRRWAYRSIRDYRGTDLRSHEQWQKTVLDKAEKIAASFPAGNHPFTYTETKATARSVAKWVWKNYTYDSERFRARQSDRGRISGQRRKATSDLRRERACALRAKGMTNTKIAEELGIHPKSIPRLLRAT